MMMKIRKLLVDSKGATAIEYGLIAALIAVAAITAMSGLGTQLNETLTQVKDEMASGGAGSGGGNSGAGSSGGGNTTAP